MVKKITFLFFSLSLLTFILHIPAFATSATISVSGARGVITVSGNATFPVDPNTGETGGTLSFHVDPSIFNPLPIEEITTGSSAVTHSFAYDSIKTGSGGHAFYAKATSRSGVIEWAYVNVTLDNTPKITIHSPLPGTIRGISTCSIAYDFPSTTLTQDYYGIIGVFWDGGGGPYNKAIGIKQVTLSATGPTTGTYEFNFDTTGLADGPHWLQVNAFIPPYGPTITTVDVTTSNTPELTVNSPSGTIRGVVQCKISYGFPTTTYSTGWLFVYRVQGASTQYLSGTGIPLSSTSSTQGIHTFSVDTNTWPDGNYQLQAKAYIIAYTNVKSTSVNITVANKTATDKQTPQEKATTVAEPVNVANGNMFTSATDILIPAPEIPLELSRTYNSQDDFNGSFGYGWRSNFDITLAEQPDNSVIEVDEKGVYTIYTKNPDNTYTPSAGKYSQLTKNSDDTFTLLRKHGRKLYFDTNARLVKIEGRNGNALNILRTSNGVIYEVNDSSERKLIFTQDAQGRITQITDPKGRTFKYVYDDSSGNLIKTIDPLNNETLYEYDSNHNLTRQADANGHLLYFEYDSSDRAYHSWQDGNNNKVTLSFDPTHHITTSTDSLGNITKYEYNDYGLVTKITDSQNKTQLFTWDSSLNKTSATSQNGNTTTFIYDSRGNLLTIKDPLTHTTTFTYEPNFDLANSITDALGNVTEYSYDTKGNLTQVKDALGNITSYTYDASGHLIQSKDANENITNFSYDGFGNLTQIINALTNQTNFTYDIIGNLIQITDAKGSATQFNYDLLNRLLQITYPNDSKVKYTYDKVGNLTSFTDPNNNITTYAYDVANRPIQTTDALSNPTQYTYDTEGNRLSIIDANLNKTQYFYDRLNRLSKTLGPLNNQTLLNYDPVGNLIAKTDSNGNTIYYVYDVLNRLIEKGLSPQGTVSLIAWFPLLMTLWAGASQ